MTRPVRLEEAACSLWLALAPCLPASRTRPRAAARGAARRGSAPTHHTRTTRMLKGSVFTRPAEEQTCTATTQSRHWKSSSALAELKSNWDSAILLSRICAEGSTAAGTERTPAGGRAGGGGGGRGRGPRPGRRHLL